MARRRINRRRRRRTRRMRRMRVRRPIATGIPQSMVVKLRYVDTVSINPNGLTPGVYVFRANSIYDPNYTGVGHQPMWHDTYATMYKLYEVLGSKITCKFINSQPGNYLVGVNKSDDPTTLMASEAIMENKASKYRYLTSTQGGGSTTLVEKYSQRGWLRNRSGSPNLTFFGANPNQPVYYRVWAEDQWKGDVNEITVTVTIEYIVRLNEARIETVTH